MQPPQIEKMHQDLINIYNEDILPIINNYFGSNTNKAFEKTNGDYPTTLVTDADLAINNILTSKLLALIPESSVISEESKDKNISKYTFVIDPIDGTHSFARNLDDWGITIELLENGETIYSIIFYPKCETKYYYAIKGKGSFDNEGNKIFNTKYFEFKPTIVCGPSSRKIGRALIDYTDGKMVSFRVYGSAVYILYTLLRGGSDFIIYDHLNIWDVLGCEFIAKEAGFVVDWVGNKPNIDNSLDLDNSHCTLAIYKPDIDKALLTDLQNIIEENY